MTDGFPKNIRRTSESHAFQQVLRRNPELSRRSDRDRDVVALTFDRAQRFGINNVAILETVFRGYRPEQVFTEPYPQPAPVIPPEDPAEYNATCNDTLIFTLAAGEEDVPDAFDFGATTGNAMSVTIDLSMYPSDVDLRIDLDTLSDDCALFLLKDGFDEYDDDPANYTIDPGETTGPTAQSWTIPAATLDAYAGRLFHVVVYHKNTLPFVTGVLRVFCVLPDVTITAASPSGVVPPADITLSRTVRLTGRSLLNTLSVAINDVTGPTTSSVSSFTPVDFETLDVEVVASLGRKTLVVTCDDPPSVSNAFPILVANFAGTGGAGVARGGQITVSLGSGDTSLSSTSAVLLNGAAATFSYSSGALLIDVPHGATVGPADVIITTAAGTFAFQDAIAVLGTPFITSISPIAILATTGPVVLELHGDHFSEVASADVDGATYFDINILDDTMLQVVIADGSVLAPGTIQVTVTDLATGTSNIITFDVVTAVNITSLSQNTLPVAGGTLTVFGNGFENLDDASEVTFGGVAAASLTPVDATEFEATAGPVLSAGIYELEVTTEDGSSPGVSILFHDISDASSSEGGVITIDGPTGVVGVTVDGIAAVFTNNSDGLLEVTIPVGVSVGLVDISITTADGVFIIPDAITIAAAGAAPTVTSVLHGVADIAGASSVDSVFGTDFVSGATVRFYEPGTGTLAGTATGVVFKASTRIDFLAPALAAGLYDLRVTNPDTQHGTLANGHEAWAPTVELAATPGEGVFLPPGGYDPSTGVWTGTNYNATAGDALNAPSAHQGMPVFSGAAGQYLSLGASFAGNLHGNVLTNAAEGTIIVGYAPFRERVTAVRPTADGAYYYNSTLITGVAASPGLAHSTSGFKALSYDGVDYQTAYAGKALDCAHHVGAMRWAAADATIEARVDGSKWCSKAMAAGGIDGGGGSNVGATTEIGRSYAGTEYYRGLVTFVFACPTKLSTATFEKFTKWAHTSGLYAFDPVKTGPTRFYLAGDFSAAGTSETWSAPTGAAWEELTYGGTGTGPGDNGSGSPMFSTVPLSGAAALAVWSNELERHFYARVTTDQITTTNSASSIFDNASPVRDSGGNTGLFLHKNGTQFYCDMFELDVGAAERKARVEITHVVDSMGAGSFTVQGKKVGNMLYVRVNNEPWQVGDNTPFTIADTSGTFQVGNEFEGTVHEVGHWAHELPNFLSNQLALRGGATDADAALKNFPGIRMHNRVEDADTTFGTELRVARIPDISHHQDPNRHLFRPPEADDGPIITQDASSNNRWRMGSVLTGGLRVRTDDQPDTAAQVSPFQAPDATFAYESAQPFTVYLVLDACGTTGATLFWMLNKDGSGVDASNFYGADDGSSYTAGVQGGMGGVNGPGRQIVCIVFNGASTTVYVNDHATANATGDGGAGVAKSLSMGAWGGAPSWGIYDRVEYDGAHSTTEREAVMLSLGAKFNIPVT